MKRIYHHHDKLEEVPAGVWRIVGAEERDYYSKAARDLMRDSAGFKAAMMAVVGQWRYSCEHNLSAHNINRQAWIGHAGCCMATGSPEDATRLGWHMLSGAEQAEANRVADECIAAWERYYESGYREIEQCLRESSGLTFTKPQNNVLIGHSTTSRESMSALARAKTAQLCFTWLPMKPASGIGKSASC